MDFITIILVALGLSLDCFAVSVTSGMASDGSRIGNALLMATSFAAFQMGMLTLGWRTALTLKEQITSVDHWIAFALLAAIGCKMLYESLRESGGQEKERRQLKVYVLLTLSLATSIDALAVGVSFAFLKTSIALPAVVIGTVTFVMALAGVFVGTKAGRLLGERAETLGGLILIGIGIRILVEHLA